MPAQASPSLLRLDRAAESGELWREVALSDVDATVANPVQSGVLWEASENSFAMNLPDVARCAVQNGGSVFVAGYSLAALPDCRWFVQGLPLAALWVQRGLLAVHASAVATPKGTILILGHSSCGKSTMAAALAMRGFGVLADEVAPIKCTAAGELTAEPSMADILLSESAMDELHLDVSRTSLARPGLTRRYVDGLPQASTATPICAIFILAAHNREQLDLRPVYGYEKLFSVMTFAFNGRLPEAAETKQRYFGKLAMGLSRVHVAKVFRPDGIWSGTELADKLLAESGL